MMNTVIGCQLINFVVCQFELQFMTESLALVDFAILLLFPFPVHEFASREKMAIFTKKVVF